MPASLLNTDPAVRHRLESTLAAWWAEILELPSIGLHDDFFSSGGNPARCEILVERIKGEFGVEMPPSALYEGRTVSKLADLIEIRQNSLDYASIVPLRTTGVKQPLFVIHGVGGNVLGFYHLARTLDTDHPVYGVQAQALQRNGPTLTRLEAMAGYYLGEIRRVQPQGPYALLGLSFGGLVAYEIAQQAAQNGIEINFLGMLDTWQPGYSRRVVRRSLPVAALGRFYLFLMNTRKLTLRQKAAYVRNRLKSRYLRLVYKRLDTEGAATLPESMLRVRDINLIAQEKYVVKPYPGKVTLFRAREQEHSEFPEDLGWCAFAVGGVEIFRLTGDHSQVLDGDNVNELAEQIAACLADAAQLSSRGLARVSSQSPDERIEFELTEEGYAG